MQMLLNGAIPGAQEPGLDWGDRPTCLIIDRLHRLGEVAVNDRCVGIGPAARVVEGLFRTLGTPAQVPPNTLEGSL
jgi:hypothetical protein